MEHPPRSAARLVNRPHFTLHVRLTRDCNAHCSYCSSAGAQGGRMHPDAFRAAIDWIAHALMPRIGVGPRHHLTVEYLGGEILLVPPAELEANVRYARNTLSQVVGTVRDGAQSNLIGAPARIQGLADLFEGRVGTSWDKHTGQRHIRGNPDLYTAILDRSLRVLQTTRGIAPGRVIVVDALTLPHLSQEVEDAAQGGYDLVLRPAFQGGSEGVAFGEIQALTEAFTKAYHQWNKTGRRQRVEPFSTLYERQQTVHQGGIQVGGQGCPFQADCAFRSLSLDPDGSLFICQEMADSGHFPLGNAVEGRFDAVTWTRLAQRQRHLDASCKACPWRQSCGGGCMNEAIASHGDPFAKTELCSVWKALFAAIDATICKERGAPAAAGA